MWDLITTVAGGVLSGGATGLLGVAINRFFDWRKEAQEVEKLKINLAAAREVREIELRSQERVAQLAADAQQRVAEMDAMARATEASEATQRASYEHDKATYTPASAFKIQGRWGRFVAGLVALLMGLVDVARGLIRPGTTVYLLILTTLMWSWAQDLGQRAGAAMTADHVHQVQLQLIGAVIYLVVTCVTWWFGSRPALSRQP